MIFNDYDENGYRLTVNNCRSHRVADESLVRNLRFKYGNDLANISDQQIVNSYDYFSVSDDFGDDDLWLEHWLEYSE